MARRISNFAGKDDLFKDSQPKVTDFESFLPWACNKFSKDVDVIITRATQEVYVGGVSLSKKATSKRKLSTLPPKKTTVDDLDLDDDMPSLENVKTVSDLENAIKIQTLYDCHENLVQMKCLQNKTIPRKIMQVIGLTIPYQKHLTSITINSGLRIDTLHEIAKFLPDSNITELCLDGTFLSKANYHILLMQGKLKHLSLARCSINDAVVKMITDQLGAASPASRVLSALNLSSNRITDVGAKYIAGMLRTNRQLSYLNIAGNVITDEGGMSILDTLQKFPLGYQESLESRVRYVAYLKKKNEFIEKNIIELQTAKDKIPKKKSAWKGKMENHSLSRVGRKPVSETGASADLSVSEKAEYLAETEMEPFSNHFSPDNTESQDGVVHCLGNNTLCYLNLAYNNLTYVSVRKLLEVLLMQKSLNRTPKGLIKVVIEGNLMPIACKEYEEINHLFTDREPGYRASNIKHTQVTKPAKHSARI